MNHGPQNGSVLGFALVMLMVFSIGGLTLLKLSEARNLRVIEYQHQVRNRYAVESALSLALWRLSGADDFLATFTTSDSVTATFIDSTEELILRTDRWNQSLEVQVSLETISLFKNTIATVAPIDTSDPSIDIVSMTSEISTIDSLPPFDSTYFLGIADYFYESGQSFANDVDSGIHYVKSGITELKNNTHLVGCLIVAGKLKVVGTNVLLKAGYDSEGNLLPALIVADSVTTTDITDITVEGAIISYSHFDIRNGLITGPFIGLELSVQVLLTIDDQGSDQYYTMYSGFGDEALLEDGMAIKPGSWREQ